MLKKISDYQVLKLQSLTQNSDNTRTDLSPTTNNLKPTNKEFRNFYPRIQVLENKSEQSKKISDSQQVTSEN